MTMPQAAERAWSGGADERVYAPRRSPLPSGGGGRSDAAGASRPLARPRVDTALRTKALILFALFAVTAAVTLIRSEESAMRGYELVQLRQQAAQLDRENRGLELEIAALKAPQRIRELAANRLGMVVPKEFYFASEGK